MSVSQRFLAAAAFTVAASMSFYLAQGQAQEPSQTPFPQQPNSMGQALPQNTNPEMGAPAPVSPPMGEMSGGPNSGVSLTQPALAPAPPPGQAMPGEGQVHVNPTQSAPQSPATEIAEPQDLHAILKTSLGEIEIKFYDRLAPNNVKNFVSLAKGERETVDVKTGRKVMRPFYDSLTFHRVVKGFLIQSGCPFGNGRGGPGYTVPDEINDTLHHDKAGIVSMAPARKDSVLQKDTNGSQFFITLKPIPELDGKATIIGEVVKGMSVVEKISRVPTGPTERPIKRVFLNSVSIISVKRGSTKK
jgi:peptidyl-prolyl cis-trans isomerase A (cyclophilin A)